MLRITIRFFNISLINAHAETEEKDEVTKESFYQRLEQAYDETPSNDIKIIIGDFNAKISKEPEFRRVAGKQSLHNESNDNGKRVVNLVSAAHI